VYHTCLFCNADLGRNEAIEAFPVGRRLAYDAARGRLWVVCPHCARWNLTPLEERWEAIEQGERLYAAARTRVGTGEIALARVADGTTLVRIGRPTRPELAAWRYGDQLGSRRRRELAWRVGAGTVGVGAMGAMTLVTGVAPIVAGMAAGALGGWALVRAMGARYVARRWVPDGAGAFLLVTVNELASVRLRAAPALGWELRVPYKDRRSSTAPRLRDYVNLPSGAEHTLAGEGALAAARALLPLVNDAGASARRVGGALAMLDELGGPDQAFAGAAARVHTWAARQAFGDTGALLHLPPEVRLALEMAAHEAQERRALEGELAELARAWQEAETIAAIADDLLLPTTVAERLRRLKARATGGDTPRGTG
jgi:hypothetical protein